ncbi:siderophore-interacting protein [Buchananella hordeovulneris]|uniref:siderophore-interacting protein n=1 Tax=Buchananella hordeovulneris TaxID=52770 RepID=UPI000F5F198F|nr:siderophore-interacting protein [Buchananella hordeovulneris]RRD52613.1 siderophore-interacting protein [Buchananella hordeovulneris]
MREVYRPFVVRVAAITEITPSFRRFTFTGPDAHHFADAHFDQRIKLVLPGASGAAGVRELAAAEQWYQAWLAWAPATRPVVRTYTVRDVRADAGQIDVDMVVHSPLGPAARWVNAARVGDEVALVGPVRGAASPGLGVDFVPPAQTDAFLLGGDETAAPAIAVILEQLPAGARGIAVVEVPQARDAAYLPHHPGLEVRVCARVGQRHGEWLTTAVAQAAAELVPPGVPHAVTEIDVDRDLLWEVPRHAKGGAALSYTSLYTWLAGEAGAVKQMRRQLVGQWGIDRRSVAFMGYWRQGRAEN